MENSKDIQKKESAISKPWVQSTIGISVAILALAGFLYWKSTSAYVAIDMSTISAPVIGIGPEAEGILAEVYVKQGDTVSANQPLARVGSETLYSKIAGTIIDVNNNPGQVFMAASPVVSMIDPSQLRVTGKIDEDKGLSRLKVGETATFTVDAFGGKTFTGIVDEVSPTSEQSGVVFSISDKREIKQFEVKVRYDVVAHPEFKNGMSAKLKVYAD